jgi:transposase
MAVEGATTARVFETYVKEVLAPSLEPGRIVVMDNLGAHRPKRVRGLSRRRMAASSCTCRATHRTTTP